MDRAIPVAEQRKKKMIRLAKYASIVIVAGAAITYLCSLTTPSVSSRSVIISQVDRGAIDISVTAVGNVVPAFEEIITSPISSRILEVYSQPGDTVRAGMSLMRLDLRNAETEYSKALDEQEIRHQQMVQLTTNTETQLSDLRLRIKTEEMRLEQLESQLRNELYLDSLGSGTKDRIRQAETTLKTAQLQLTQLKQQYDNERKVKEAEYKVQSLRNSIYDKALNEQRRTLEVANITSPRAATLTYINTEIGAAVGAGTKIAVISDLSHYKVECTINDTHSEKIKIGGRVLVKTGKEMLEGNVSNINPLSNNGSINFTVVLKDSSHKKLRSGLKTDVYVITYSKDDVLRLRNGAFYNGAGDYTLFVCDKDNKLMPRTVKVGDSNYEKVEIISGLSEGDKVIVSNMDKYKGVNELKLDTEE
ncbi:MAG: efflux RND transporter periplasmic adaptor subunit [Bacteroidales bacterium]|nr:efflux RND transporter periplasmic adaptor subunit [Bacteroidales bacterium]